MNKLYILGALALANVDAKVAFATTDGIQVSTLTGAAGATTIALSGLGGTYTYAHTGDCLASGALTTLGLNNIYYQYYFKALTTGTATFATATPTTTYESLTDTPTPAITNVALSTITNTYNGCWHAHIYNWVAMASLATTAALTSVTSGYASAVVGYGYAMIGSTAAACAVSAIVFSTTPTPTLFFTTTNFQAAQFQSSIINLSSATGTAPSTTVPSTIPVWGRQGPGYYATKVGTAQIAAMNILGIAFAATQNSYWDFMQYGVIKGLTTVGRGGGLLGTGPCGWYVGYYYEAPARGISHQEDSFNVKDDAAAPTVHFWTDNSVVKAASAFVIAGLAGLLF